MFGDVNLSKGRPSSKNLGTPGKGGWPTLRHYNSETGLEGVQYVQKTKKAICDEMKEANYMETYVMEVGVTSNCNASNSEGCSDKEKEYIEKYKGKASDISAQNDRLAEMSKKEGAKQSITGYKWLAQRRSILRQLTSTDQEL